jgi:hypothetical protein
MRSLWLHREFDNCAPAEAGGGLFQSEVCTEGYLAAREGREQSEIRGLIMPAPPNNGMLIQVLDFSPLGYEMNKLWNKYLVWLERRRQKRLEWWKRKRAKGKFWFVTWFICYWAGSMIIFTTISDYYIYGNFRLGMLPFKLIYYPLVGFIIGLLIWWDSERKYQHSLRANTDANASTNRTTSSVDEV